MSLRDDTATPNLLDNLSSLVEHLRVHGLRLSVNDELRLETLRQEVQRRGGGSPNLKALEQLIAPLVCRNADEQDRLAAILRRWPMAGSAKAGKEGLSGRTAKPLFVWLRSGLALAAVAVLGWMLDDLPARLGRFLIPDVGGSTQEQATTSWQIALPDLGTVALVLAAILPLVLASLLIRWRKRQPVLIRQQAPRHAAARALEISVASSTLFRPGAVRGAVRDLRRHRLVSSTDIDIRRSVAATAGHAGFFQIIRAQRVAMPDYVVLSDRVSSQDHVGDLGDVLAARLQNDHLRVTHAEHYGDPRRLMLINRDGGRRAMPLQRLATRLPGARVLMFADAASLWDPMRRRPRAWVGALRAFESVAILTPVPRDLWGEHEQRARDAGFEVVPATSEGLTDLARHFRFSKTVEGGGASPPEAGQLDAILTRAPFSLTGDRSPGEEETARLITLLRDTLEPGAFLHLRALAVFPAINPRLTEQVGRMLVLNDGSPAMREQSYAAMARLPWLRRARMPDWLRKALIESLSEHEARRIRSLWTTLLSADPAGREDRIVLDVVSPQPGRETLRNLLRALHDEPSPELAERILLAFLAGDRLPDLSVAAPRRLARKRNLPSFDGKDAAIAGAGIIAALIIFQVGRILQAGPVRGDALLAFVGLGFLLILSAFAVAVGSRRRTTILSHPKELYVLSLVQMWERFAYYGMRSLLVLYLVQQLRLSDAETNRVYGSFTALIYITPVLGGYLADRWIGHRSAVFSGGIVLALGYALLALASEGGLGPLWLALSLIVVGSGFFKANSNVLVGTLYPGDHGPRDSAYTIFYMAVNAGSVFGTLLIGYVGERFGWSYGFGLAAVAMILGTIIFALCGRLGDRQQAMPEVGRRWSADLLTGPLKIVVPVAIAATALVWVVAQSRFDTATPMLFTGSALLLYIFVQALRTGGRPRSRLFAATFLIAAQVGFWSLFEASGSSLILFVDRFVDLGGIPAGQSPIFESLFLVILAPLLAWLWMALARRGLEPSAPAKFGLALLLLGLAFLLLTWGAGSLELQARVPMTLFLLFVLLQAAAELCLVPTGLSAMSKLAPRHMAALIMGTWFLAISASQYVGAWITDSAGTIESMFAREKALASFAQTGWLAVGASVVVLAATPMVRRWIHAGMPEDSGESADSPQRTTVWR
jgi:POT family proton-dependent oligopeptide transporter